MNISNQNEHWKPVSFDQMNPAEKFDISDFGRLRGCNKKGEKVVITPSKIKGYPIISIKLLNGKRTTRYVHKLVAACFVNQEHADQTYVIHLDFNKENNHYRNLKWANRKELFKHQSRNPNYRKGVIRYSKLTETDVIRLKKKLKRAKNPLYKIAKEFGITHTQLNRIRSGENWGHVRVE